MNFDISIKDFQIIKSASLQFVPGLTVIQGESNNGKSAVFRAVKSAIYNEPGTTHVRTGCKNYIVGINNQSHKVILQKGDSALYLIDGQQYTKIGKTQLEDVASVLNIKALSINGQTEKINFWDQMEKPFLLDRNASDLFKFIVDSGEDDNLNETLRNIVSDKNKLNVDKNLKEGAINSSKDRINKLTETLASSEEDITACEEVISFGPQVANLLITNNIINTITTTNTNRDIINKELEEEKSKREILLDMIRTSEFDISRRNQMKVILEQIESHRGLITSTTESLGKRIDFTQELPKLETDINKYIKLHQTIERMVEINKSVGDIGDVSRLSFNVDEALVTKCSALNMLIKQMQNILGNINVTNNDLLTLNNIVSPLKEELNSFKVCPMCGQTLDNHVMEGGE